MNCEAVHTGSHFLAAALSNLDCQGRTIGAYGFSALSDPSSPVARALGAVLTVLIALFGIRLLLGRALEVGDFVDDAIRIGLFLALATSWPAWRVVAYNLVLDGPAQVGGSIGRAAGLPGAAGDLIAGLQNLDDGMVTLTMYGSGRLTGGISGGSDLGDATSGIALADQTALGSGRTTFLVTVIGAQGLLRIGAGLLLALAPLMAGLLLFTESRGVFRGWLRGLGFCALGSLAFSIIAGVELALLYPWLTDVLAQRQANVLTPSAPTELFVLTLGFAFATGGLLLLIARILFLPSWHAVREYQRKTSAATPAHFVPAASMFVESPLTTSNRASLISASLEQTMRREERVSTGQRTLNLSRAQTGNESDFQNERMTNSSVGRLGDAGKRNTRRTSAAGQRRDQT